MTFNFKNPDYLPIFKKRIENLNKIRTDPKLLEASKIYYAENPADFISDWMITYDPRTEMKNLPFLLWDRQRQYIEWLQWHYNNKQDGLSEKTRDAGVTYLNMGYAICKWLFQTGFKAGFGSRKQDLVDKIGDPDSIFEKGRMIIRNLPFEYLPKGYNEQKHLSFMKFINPENGSTITGEAGDNIGRGGRNGIYFADEAAHYERPERIDAALSQNTDVRIDVSTPCGEGNPFHKKRQSYKTEHIFIFDWRDDPRKDDKWYEKQKKKLEPWILAQEVDRDYSAAVEGICIPARFVKAAIELKLPSSGAIVAGLDVADEGEDANALAIRRGIRVYFVEDWKEGDTTQTSRKAVNICNEHIVDMLNYDSIGVGAGVKGETNSLKEKHTAEGRRFPVVVGVNTGSSALTGMYDEERTEKDMFVNLRACLWWKLRRRFERTYEYVNGIKDWPIDELISICRDEELISQLSQPKREINEAGKIKIESKEKMKGRGLKSQNKADALVLSFANPEMIPVHASGHIVQTSMANRVYEFVTGKTKVPPWITDKQKSKRYIDFGDNR